MTLFYLIYNSYFRRQGYHKITCFFRGCFIARKMLNLSKKLFKIFFCFLLYRSQCFYLADIEVRVLKSR